MKFKGSFPALVTPFTQNGVDYGVLSKLAKEVAKNSSGLTILGSTAESWLLSLEEKIEILKTCREVTDKPIIVGISAWNIEDFNIQQKALSQYAPDAYLLTAPPYLNIDTHQAKNFFLGCAVKMKIPLILYHNPKRNGVQFDKTIYDLASLYPEIIGFKETCADTFKRYYPQYNDLIWFVGDDSLLGEVHTGSSINVGGNLYPDLFNNMINNKLEIDLSQWNKLMSTAPNPMVIKQLLVLEKKIPSAACRSPLNHVRPEQKSLIVSLYEQLILGDAFKSVHQLETSTV